MQVLACIWINKIKNKRNMKYTIWFFLAESFLQGSYFLIKCRIPNNLNISININYIYSSECFLLLVLNTSSFLWKMSFLVQYNTVDHGTISKFAFGYLDSRLFFKTFSSEYPSKVLSLTLMFTFFFVSETLCHVFIFGFLFG